MTRGPIALASRSTQFALARMLHELANQADSAGTWPAIINFPAATDEFEQSATIAFHAELTRQLTMERLAVDIIEPRPSPAERARRRRAAKRLLRKLRKNGHHVEVVP